MRLTALRSGQRSVAPGSEGTAEILVRVRGGYHPDVVHARADQPIRMAFLREETASCSERVVFPAFGKSATLPRGQRIVVELPASPPGTYEFSCAFDMLHGSLVLE